jgi:hypothetical protein
MQRSPDLREVQSLFWLLLTAPEGASQGVAELRRAGQLESEDLSFLVRSDTGLGPIERLDIYAGMYFYRLRDCLAEDFPKLAIRIGAARFHNLVTDYLLAHPSTHFSLRELGRALPDFLRGHPLAREFPALSDLARFEWARVDVFDDADAAPLSRQALLEEGASAPEKFAVTLIPSARLLRLDASVLKLWRQLRDSDGTQRDDEVTGSSRGETRGVRVWRKGFSVFHSSLPADEESCLQALAAGGATLAQLGELLLERRPPDAPPGQAAQRLAELLDLWARDELLTACSSLASE